MTAVLGTPLSTFARSLWAGGAPRPINRPVLLWETLARKSGPGATTLPADGGHRPRLGDPLVYEMADLPELKIGRTPDNELVIDDESVSRTHAALRYDARAEAWSIVDLGSSNGTFARGERLKPQTPFQLGENEELVIGSAAIRFHTALSFSRFLKAIEKTLQK